MRSLQGLPPFNRRQDANLSEIENIKPCATLIIPCRGRRNEDLGFVVSQADREHWAVTHHNPLPELHFYSERELAQFASYKAHHYAKRLFPENRA